MLDQVSASLDQYTDLDPATLTLAVRQAVVTMPAEAALKASKAPDVLAVDPLSDLEDGYSGTAARVVAKAGPDLYAAYTTLVLGETITPAYEPTKSGETK